MYDLCIYFCTLHDGIKQYIVCDVFPVCDWLCYVHEVHIAGMIELKGIMLTSSQPTKLWKHYQITMSWRCRDTTINCINVTEKYKKNKTEKKKQQHRFSGICPVMSSHTIWRFQVDLMVMFMEKQIKCVGRPPKWNSPASGQLGMLLLWWGGAILHSQWIVKPILKLYI